LLADSVDAIREAKRVRRDHGAGAFALTAAVIALRRAFKLIHVLAPMVFGKQPEGVGLAPRERLDALLSGGFTHLLNMTVQAAREPRRAQAAGDAGTAAQTDFDAEWTVADARQQLVCAALAGQRRGVSLAARRLEAREAWRLRCRNAAVLKQHPSTGTRRRHGHTSGGSTPASARGTKVLPGPPGSANGRSQQQEGSHTPMTVMRMLCRLDTSARTLPHKRSRPNIGNQLPRLPAIAAEHVRYRRRTTTQTATGSTTAAAAEVPAGIAAADTASATRCLR
jgi:hypothetical protein